LKSGNPIGLTDFLLLFVLERGYDPAFDTN